MMEQHRSHVDGQKAHAGIRKHGHWWWNEEVAEAVREKKKSMIIGKKMKNR